MFWSLSRIAFVSSSPEDVQDTPMSLIGSLSSIDIMIAFESMAEEQFSILALRIDVGIEP